MARKTNRQSDENYNARRRYLRNAKKYLGKAKETIGAEREKFVAIARDLTEKAAELYERKADISRSANFQALAGEFGIQVNEFMQPEKPTKRDETRAESLRKESERLVKPREMDLSEWRNLAREREANLLLSTKAGSRIYAGLIDIWGEELEIPTDTRRYKKNADDINTAIMQHFGLSSMMDVIEFLQKKTETDIFALPKDQVFYDEVTIQLAKIASQYGNA